MTNHVQRLAADPGLRLQLDSAALLANWRWFGARAGVPMAAAVKADGYGLGAREVVARLRSAGCTTFCVSSWNEAYALGPIDADIVVLHGFVAGDMEMARALPRVRPVLVTLAQVAAWQAAFGDRVADVMIDTGINRLGLAMDEIGALGGRAIHTVHSHLACADLPGHPLTDVQLERFRAVVAATPGVKHALANSAGICCGRDFSFDMVRPGLGLYGGVPHPAAQVKAVVRPEMRVLQVRKVPVGESVGYAALWTARRDSRVAIVHVGYADGLPRTLGPALRFRAGEQRVEPVGRMSMDMLALDVTDADVAEGDWLSLEFDLEYLSEVGGISQYELLTGLSRRYARQWS